MTRQLDAENQKNLQAKAMSKQLSEGIEANERIVKSLSDEEMSGVVGGMKRNSASLDLVALAAKVEEDAKRTASEAGLPNYGTGSRKEQKTTTGENTQQTAPYGK